MSIELIPIGGIIMESKYDLKSNLTSLCETFLEYVNELFDKGQINEKELEEISKEKIKYLEYVNKNVKHKE